MICNVTKNIDSIADHIKDYVALRISGRATGNLGLFDGDFGLLLFTHYYSRYYSADTFKDISDTFLEHCFHLFGEQIHQHSFASGASGMLFTLAHLNERKFIDVDITEANELYKDYLINQMLSDATSGHYDFYDGSLGTAKYLLKYGAKDDQSYVNTLVDLLYDRGIKDRNTIKWVYEQGQNKIIQLALAHGIAGVILFLTKVINHGIESEKIWSLLKRSINYLLSTEIDYKTYNCHFQSFHTLYGKTIRKSSLAWCTGDMSIAFALWEAAKITKDCNLQNKALNIFLDAANRFDQNKEFVEYNGICHGIAGVSHLFRRLYYETAIDRFKSASDVGIERIIEKSNRLEDVTELRYLKGNLTQAYSFILGVSGVGLSLLSSVSQERESLDWDDILF